MATPSKKTTFQRLMQQQEMVLPTPPKLGSRLPAPLKSESIYRTRLGPLILPPDEESEIPRKKYEIESESESESESEEEAEERVRKLMSEISLRSKGPKVEPKEPVPKQILYTPQSGPIPGLTVERKILTEQEQQARLEAQERERIQAEKTPRVQSVREMERYLYPRPEKVSRPSGKGFRFEAPPGYEKPKTIKKVPTRLVKGVKKFLKKGPEDRGEREELVEEREEPEELVDEREEPEELVEEREEPEELEDEITVRVGIVEENLPLSAVKSVDGLLKYKILEKNIEILDMKQILLNQLKIKTPTKYQNKDQLRHFFLEKILEQFSLEQLKEILEKGYNVKTESSGKDVVKQEIINKAQQKWRKIKVRMEKGKVIDAIKNDLRDNYTMIDILNLVNLYGFNPRESFNTLLDKISVKHSELLNNLQ